MPFASLWLLPLIYIVKSYYFFPFTEPFINLLSRVYHFNAVRVLGVHSHQRAMLRHTRKQELKYVGGCLRVIQSSALFSDAEYKECLLTSPQVWREEQPACRRRQLWGCPGRWAPVWVRSKTCCSSRHPGVCGIFSPGTRNKVPTITVSLILLQILFSLIELITQREVSDAFCFVLLRQYLPKIQATHCFS